MKVSPNLQGVFYTTKVTENASVDKKMFLYNLFPMSKIIAISFICIATISIFLLSCHKESSKSIYWNKEKYMALFEENDTIKIFGGGLLKQVTFKKSKSDKLEVISSNLDTKLFLKELYETSKSKLMYIKKDKYLTIKNDLVTYTFIKYDKNFKWDSITFKHYNHRKILSRQKTYYSDDNRNRYIDIFSYLIFMGIDDLYSPQTSTNDYIIIELFLPDNTIKKAKATILPEYVGRIFFKKL